MTDNARSTTWQPLAARLRPRSIQEFFGQSHLLAYGKPLRYAVEAGQLHSMILWGPPGTGKTTLAHLLAQKAKAQIETLSAVMAGVKDIRQIADRAKQNLKQFQTPTILFVDEVHRFNKAQQDAFLPYVEEGTLTLIGATTENPSFELNNALLSRARIYVLNSLTEQELSDILERTLTDRERGLGAHHIELTDTARQMLLRAADGDARQLLNILELAVQVGEAESVQAIDENIIERAMTQGYRRFDKGGDEFYEQISALHKSVRGSAPQASLYWLCRMLDGGCDPDYIGRRIVRMASEDIGNADPKALSLAMDSWQAYERLGTPEGELALAQAVTYLAVAPKSNAIYTAYNQAMRDAREYGSQPVPAHLRNAPTRLMKHMGYGKQYRYAHDEPEAYAAGERYFPETMPEREYYQPVQRGFEIKIKDKLQHLQQLDLQYRQQQDEGSDD